MVGRRSTLQRAGILRLASEIFSRRGFVGASMNEVASAIGLSKASLYHHFSSKEALYVEIILDVLKRMCGEVGELVRSAPDAETKLRAFMHGHAKFFEENMHQITVSHFGLDVVRESPEIGEIMGWRDTYEHMLRGILAEGAARGRFERAEVAVAGRMVLSLLNEMPRWYRTDGKRTATQFADLYCDLMLNGLRPRA